MIALFHFFVANIGKIFQTNKKEWDSHSFLLFTHTNNNHSQLLNYSKLYNYP